MPRGGEALPWWPFDAGPQNCRDRVGASMDVRLGLGRLELCTNISFCALTLPRLYIPSDLARYLFPPPFPLFKVPCVQPNHPSSIYPWRRTAGHRQKSPSQDSVWVSFGSSFRVYMTRTLYWRSAQGPTGQSRLCSVQGNVAWNAAVQSTVLNYYYY